MPQALAPTADPAWVLETQKAEFLLMMRGAVSDRRVTEGEHRRLDLARDLPG